MTVTISIHQRLYDSEVNFEVSVFYDAGFDVRLGDHLNGFLVKDKVVTWADAETWLREQDLALFPDSKFAQDDCGRRRRISNDGAHLWMGGGTPSLAAMGNLPERNALSRRPGTGQTYSAPSGALEALAGLLFGHRLWPSGLSRLGPCTYLEPRLRSAAFSTPNGTAAKPSGCSYVELLPPAPRSSTDYLRETSEGPHSAPGAVLPLFLWASAGY
jgi:hypothetical protein